MSKHTMTAYAPWGLQPDAIECQITFTYYRGCDAVMYGNPQPADPASVDFHAVTCKHPLDAEMQAMLDEWAGEYLAGEGYADAIAHVRDREDA